MPTTKLLKQDPERLSRIVEACLLLYEEDMPKREVAAKLRTSIPELNLLIADARKFRILRITIAPPPLLELQRRLVRRWKLKGAIVVPRSEKYSLQRQLLGEAAAEHLEKKLKLSEPKVWRVACSGGQTMWEMANAVGPIDKEVEILPTALIGRGGAIDHADPTSVVTQLFEKGPKVTAVCATVLPLDRRVSRDLQTARSEQLRILHEQPRIKEVFERMRSADIVYTGVGLVERPRVQDPNHVNQTPALNFLGEFGVTPEKLCAVGAVGDVNYSFFDSRGRPLRDLDLFISLTATDLKEMVEKGKEVVLIAGHKEGALRAALSGRLCTHVITDMESANKLCDV